MNHQYIQELNEKLAKQKQIVITNKINLENSYEKYNTLNSNMKSILSTLNECKQKYIQEKTIHEIEQQKIIEMIKIAEQLENLEFRDKNITTLNIQLDQINNITNVINQEYDETVHNCELIYQEYKLKNEYINRDINKYKTNIELDEKLIKDYEAEIQNLKTKEVKKLSRKPRINRDRKTDWSNVPVGTEFKDKYYNTTTIFKKNEDNTVSIIYKNTNNCTFKHLADSTVELHTDINNCYVNIKFPNISNAFKANREHIQKGLKIYNNVTGCTHSAWDNLYLNGLYNNKKIKLGEYVLILKSDNN